MALAIKGDVTPVQRAIKATAVDLANTVRKAALDVQGAEMQKSPKDRVTTIMNELSSGKRAANGAWIEKFGDNKPAPVEEILELHECVAEDWASCLLHTSRPIAVANELAAVGL